MPFSTKKVLNTYGFSLLLCGTFLIGIGSAYADEQKNETSVPMEDVQRFSSAISDVKNYYVKSVDDKKLFDNAIRGMLSGLDPHSSYLDEDEFKELQEATAGQFGGLGIEVTMENGVIKVIAPLDDTPASKAGIKAGDYIIRLGKTPISGLSLREAVNMMRGEAGSNINLTIIRKGANKPLNFNLVRSAIKVKSVKGELLDKEYSYIKLSHFQEQTAEEMVNLIKKLQQQAGGKLKGLVLDLRNNPGGLLDSAVQTADAFIDSNKQIIVYTKGRIPGSEYTAYATAGDVMNKAPIVVLINSGSASGAEIVAGALKDSHRAVIVGTRSFGKGSVQTVIPLDKKTGIKLTTALYYTPNGISIQAKGIEPDIKIEEMTLPQTKQSEASNDNLFGDFSESDLNGHLANGNGTDKNTATQADKVEVKDLAHKDYQLFQALMVLKGIELAKVN